MLPVTRMERVISHRRQEGGKIFTGNCTCWYSYYWSTRHVSYILFCKQFSASDCNNFHINVHFRCVSKDAKMTVSSVMLIGLSIRPSVRLSFLPHGKTPLRLKGFSWNFTLEPFINMCRENSFSVKSGQYKALHLTINILL